MASSAILRNGSPQPVFYGTDDQSIPPLVPEPVVSPIHQPLMFTFASRGDHKNAYTVLGDSLLSMYGRDVVDVTSDYATFNTPFLKMFNEEANAMMVQRLVPEDADTATLRLYAEVYVDKVPIYERAADGSIVYSPTDGKPVKTGEKNGVRIVWRVAPFAADPFKQGVIFTGTIVGSDGKKSMIYPVMDLPCSFIGKKGSDIGIRLSAPNAKSSTPVDSAICAAIGSRLLTVQFVERDDVNSTPVVTKTLDGAASVTVSLKKGAYYRDMRLNLDIEKVLVKSYRNMNPDVGLPPDLGPVEDLFIYRNNLEAVLTQANASLDQGFGSDVYLVDIFTGLDVDGNPYNGLLVDAGTLGGEVFTEAHTHYLLGGSDGTMTNDTFDALVRQEMNSFGSGTVDYLDIARYPCTHLWDTGFSTQTKVSLARFIGLRPDTNLTLVTHVYNKGVNDMQTENSMKIALAGFARAYPESQRYGTPACRAIVVGHSYLLNDSEYTERVPVAYSLAKFIAKYAGAQEGKFKAEFRFSRGELAVVTEGYDINLRYKTPDAYSSDWETGLINVRSFDQQRFFFPALQTVSPNDRSILNGWINALIIGDLERVADRVWREVSGASDLTNAEMIKMVNEKIIQKTEGKYDGVVDIVPDAYFTAADLSNGYSITVDIHLYGNVIKTVNKYTIVAHRRSDAAAA